MPKAKTAEEPEQLAGLNSPFQVLMPYVFYDKLFCIDKQLLQHKGNSALYGITAFSFDELCKLRENWTLGSIVPVMTSRKNNKSLRSFPPPVHSKCQQLYFAAGTY